jgi:RNA polymerase sigma-70 factor (ECF subfamily)
MLFTVCNPLVSSNAQITFALRVLCGFSIEEIANALLANKVTVNKRLLRTRKVFKENNIQLLIPTEDKLNLRLDNVLLIIYLLFNEGYFSSTSENKIRKDLCIESMRLLYLLLNHLPSNLPHVNALMALFCFHSSRFDARFNEVGKIVLYEDQDKAKWDKELINKGEDFLKISSKGNRISKYHLEALIAFWHTRIGEEETTKWNNILQLYNRLLQIEYSPIVALNRTYALSKVKGKEEAIKEALKIRLKDSYLYYSFLAHCYEDIDNKKQKESLEIALKLAKTNSDKEELKRKLRKLI